MNKQKVCFIYCIKNSVMYNESLLYLQSLHIPTDIGVEVIAIDTYENVAKSYNEAMKSSDAKYKIYLKEDVFILNKNILTNIINIFEDDESLGLLGVVGSKTLAPSGYWWDSEQIYGKVYSSHSGKMELLSYLKGSNHYEQVLVLDGLILITQYDVPFKEQAVYTDVSYDSALCLDYVSNGYKVGVVEQDNPWCMHDCGQNETFVNVDKRQAFVADYRKFMYNSEVKEFSYEGIPLYHAGVNLNFEGDVKFIGNEAVSIGDHVTVKKNALFETKPAGSNDEPKIIIGDYSVIGMNCHINSRYKISIGNHVKINSNVLICDHETYKRVGVASRLAHSQNEIIIEDFVSIGSNCTIIGKVKIGMGAVIESNSVIKKNVPSYSLVSGSFGEVTQVYDKVKGKWVNIRNEHELSDVLKCNESSTPLISICIPTYLRANNLDQCLQSIYSQIGNDEQFEVIVCSNDSPDHTDVIVSSYEKNYSNFKYYKNESNIGADRNVLKVLELATGQFLMPHGDDDFFVPGSLYDLYNMVNEHRDCGLFFINVLNNSKTIVRMSGMKNYLDETSVDAGFISSLIIKKCELDRLQDKAKFIDSCLNQIYIQYSILQNNPNFCVRYEPIFTYADNLTGGYNWARVFIKNYLEIMKYFIGKGLSEEDVEHNKLSMLSTVYKWFGVFLHKNMEQFGIKDFEEIFIECYQKESYFKEAFAVIQDIKNKVNTLAI